MLSDIGFGILGYLPRLLLVGLKGGDMTIKELESLSFEFRGNEMIKNGCHTAYYNKQYDIMVIVEEKWIRKGLRISRIFRYKGKEYRKMERFLEVIKDVEFIERNE